MTITNINASLTIGNADDADLGIIKTTLAAATNGYILSSQLTMTQATSIGKIVAKLYHVSSPFDLSTALAFAQLIRVADTVDVVAHGEHLGVNMIKTPFEMNAGGFLYTWFEALDVSDAGSINLKLTEI